MPVLAASNCDDPVPGPQGAIVLVISSVPTDDASDRDIRAIDTLTLDETTIEAEWTSPTGETRWITLSAEEAPIPIRDESADLVVGQFPVPEGEIDQIRFYMTGATLALDDDTSVTYDGPPNLPSHTQSGWKLESLTGTAIAVHADALTGIRVIFDFDERLHHNNGIGYQLRPTAPYEEFSPNPAPGVAGVHLDQLTVLFPEGTNRSDADAVAQRLGGQVLYEPVAGLAWRLSLPVDVDIRRGAERLHDESLVQGVLPATDYGDYSYLPSDASNTNYHDAIADDAWTYLQDGGLDVGSRTVRVAVIDDSGVDVRHQDLYLNIGINQAEIPAYFKRPADAWAPGTTGTCTENCIVDVPEDGARDGIITFTDLNDDVNDGGIRGTEACTASKFPVCDWNANGRVDGEDILQSLGDGLDNDDWDPSDDKTTVDDLVGYWFGGSIPNKPTPENPEKNVHGTAVAGLVGAMPADAPLDEQPSVREEYRDGIGNGGSVGIAWKVSLVPLKTTMLSDIDQEVPVDSTVTPDVAFLDAISWIERVDRDPYPGNDIDIAVASMGFVFYEAGSGAANCARTTSSEDKQRLGIEAPQFGTMTSQALDDFDASDQGALIRSGHVLYVFAAGNENMNIGRSDVLAVPSGLFITATSDDPGPPARANTIVVGWSTGPRNQQVPATDANYGTEEIVDVFAPGSGWYVLTPSLNATDDGGITSMSGSSTAAPVVAGAAVLLKAQSPTLTAAQIRERILGAAEVRETIGEKSCLVETTMHDNMRNLDVAGALE